MSTGTLPVDLPRSLLNRRIRREVDATVTDYMRLGDWDEQLAVSVVERMLHHKDAHGVMEKHWAELFDDQQPGTNSGGSPKQVPPRGLASQAADVARRILLRLLPSRPELFTSSVCTLVLGMLCYLMDISNKSGGKSSLRQLQRFSGSQQQYEDTAECALRVLEGPDQQQLQQPMLLAPAPAMWLLAELCASQHAPLLPVLCSARCAALTMRCLFDPRIMQASMYAAIVLKELFREGTSWVCDPILFTSTIRDALGHAESCMVWQAAYGNAAFAQAARLPFNKNNTARLHTLTAFHFEVVGCALLFRAMFQLPIDMRAGLLMRRPGLLRPLCTLCDLAGRHVAACGASSRVPGGLWFDAIGETVITALAKYTRLICASPNLGPAHVRAMELSLSCLLHMCERAPRLKATTTSAVLLSFEVWHAILEFCGDFTGGQEQAGVMVVLDRHAARAALLVLGRTHALGRLLEAAVRTERWLEGRPGGIADVNSKQPCHVVDALLSAALLQCVSLVSTALDSDGMDSTAGQQQHLADVQRIYSALLAARESYTGPGGSAVALSVPAQVQELVRDLQRTIAALAPHGIPDV